MVSGGVVEQGHASLMCLALSAGRIRACLADCWSESFGCGGLTLASELGQSQLPDVLQKPASKGNSSTIATPRKQCQTQILHVTTVLQFCRKRSTRKALGKARFSVGAQNSGFRLSGLRENFRRTSVSRD